MPVAATTNQPKQYRKDNYLQNLAGIGANQLLTPVVMVPTCIAAHDRFIKEADKFPEIGNYFQEALIESKLDKTGLKVEKFKVTTEPINYLHKIISLSNPILGTELGRNAFYAPTINSIGLPENKLHAAMFHEMGHAMNKNFSKGLKFLQSLRMPIQSLGVALSIAGICTSMKKPSEDEKLNTGDKIKNFLHNNAGKLVFATSIPVLIEERMATIKGNKLAKKLLPENLYKNVKNANKYGFLCYSLSAVIGALGVTGAVKLKDYLVEQKHKKIDMRMAD